MVVTRGHSAAVLETVDEALDTGAEQLRRQTAEHPFGTIKGWMSATHFVSRKLKRVSTEMSLQVLAYNVKRVIAILGIKPLMEAIRA